MKKRIIAIATSGLVTLLAYNPALAQGLTVPTKPTGLPGDAATTLSGTLVTYINVFLVVVGILSVAFIIYGGFRYITSGGNDEAAESGKKIITNAIIGLVIIIFSYIIVTVIFRALAQQVI